MSGGESEAPPQLVVPEGLAEPRPASGAGVGGSVEATQAETTVEAPAPSAGETRVRPTAPGASGGPKELRAPRRNLPPERGAYRIFDLSFFCFSLSSDSCYFFSRKQKAAPVVLAPLKAVKRGAQSTPGSARPKSPPPEPRRGGAPSGRRGAGDGDAEGTRAGGDGCGPRGYSSSGRC